MEKIKIGIIGAGGFTGRELLSILANHPNANVSYITSAKYSSQSLPSVYKNFEGKFSEQLKFTQNPNDASEIPQCDLYFLATPDATSLKLAPTLSSRSRVIDLSGSFRIKDKHIFNKFYNLVHNEPQALQQAVIGLSEIYRQEIKSAKLVANPGCYASSAIYPLWTIRHHLKEACDFIFIDAKSGTSGAGGRKETDGLSFSQVYENFKPYKTQAHQHTPEIEQEVQIATNNKKLKIKFLPQLLPSYRGILCNSWIKLKEETDPAPIIKAMKYACSKETFLRYYERAEEIELKNVQHTNFVDMSIVYDKNTHALILISTIDNLTKGAAGSAIQNMNIMFNLKESTSLI